MEDFIKLILENKKPLQWKINQLHQLGQEVYTQLNAMLPDKAVSEKITAEISEYHLAMDKLSARLYSFDELVHKKSEIEQEYLQYQSRLEKLEMLKAQHDALSNLGDITIELTNLGGQNKEAVRNHILTLQEVVRLFDRADTPLEEQLSGLAFIIKSNLEKIEADYLSALEAIPEAELKSKFERLKQDVQNRITAYNEYATKILTVKEDLDQISIECLEVIEQFEAHHLQNEKIYGALSKREGVLAYVERISGEIAERLNAYDAELRTLVAQRDVLPIYQLKELNNPTHGGSPQLA